MKSRSSSALEIAKKTRKQLSEKSISLISILRECKTICRYLEITEKHKWIDYELNGYSSIKKLTNNETEQKIIPDYRQVYQQLQDEYERPVTICDGETTTTYLKYDLVNSISELISSEKHGAVLSASSMIDFLNSKNFKSTLIPNFSPTPIVHNSKIPPSQIAKALNGIENRIYEFLDLIILKLEYGQIPENIFEGIRHEVDDEFTKLCPDALEKLLPLYEQLNSDNEIIYSQIAGTCRNIIKDVSDSLYHIHSTNLQIPDSKKLNESKFINRILTSIKNETEKSVFKSMFEYTDNFLHSIQQYASKGVHSEFKKSDAIRCIVYTYMVLGDILYYYSNSKNISNDLN